MKKLFEEDDDELQGIDKAGILVKVIPFVLIIIILAITLVVGKLKKEDSPEDLQQSIMDYADENRNGAGPDITVNAGASNDHTPAPQEPERKMRRKDSLPGKGIRAKGRKRRRPQSRKKMPRLSALRLIRRP